MAPNTSAITTRGQHARAPGIADARSRKALSDRAGEALRLARLLAEGLHGAHGVQGLARHGRRASANRSWASAVSSRTRRPNRNDRRPPRAARPAAPSRSGCGLVTTSRTSAADQQ